MSDDPRLAELSATFDILGDWEERYAHIIAMGRDLPPLTAEERNAHTRIHGCVSQVWLVVEGTADCVRLRGDSDAQIVKGLIAVVVALADQRSAPEISALNFDLAFSALGLSGHLSAQRANGLAAMTRQLQGLARGMCADNPA